MFDPEQFLSGKQELEEMMGYQALFDLQPRTRRVDHFLERLHLSPENLSYATNLITHLQEEYHRKTEGRRLVITSAFNLLITFICRIYGSEKEDTVSPLTQMAKVMSHIQKHFRERIQMDELAIIASLSISQLQRKFKQTYNATRSMRAIEGLELQLNRYRLPLRIRQQFLLLYSIQKSTQRKPIILQDATLRNHPVRQT
jgi:AraC-like DNA-binding protein